MIQRCVRGQVEQEKKKARTNLINRVLREESDASEETKSALGPHEEQKRVERQIYRFVSSKRVTSRHPGKGTLSQGTEQFSIQGKT